MRRSPHSREGESPYKLEWVGFLREEETNKNDGGGFKKSVFKIKDFLLKLPPSVYLWTEGGLAPA